MSTPTDSTRDELRALRERAYGPAADIHDDPEALARLHELEAQAGVTRGVGAVSARPDDAQPAAPTDPAPLTATPAAATVNAHTGTTPTPHPTLDPSPAAPTDPAGGDEDAPGDGIPSTDPEAAADTAPAPQPWWRRRMPLLWAGSVVAALLLGVGLTLGAQALDSGRVAVLHEDPEADWPREVWGGPTEDSVAFDDFYGLSVLSQPQALGQRSTPVPCLVIFVGVASNVSYVSGACGAGPFPAQSSILVDEQMPQELRERFAEGTALQFVLEGNEVRVYAREPGLVEPTP